MGMTLLTAWGVFLSTTVLKTSLAREAVVTCSTTAAVSGGTATVTCHFPVNVTEVRPVILSVERYAYLESNSTEVLECRWMVGEEAATCTPREGYGVEGPEGSELILHIPNLSEQEAGGYACKMMTPSLDTPDPVTCQLRPTTLPVLQEGISPEGEYVENTDEVDLAQTEDIGITDEVSGPASDSGQTVGIAVGVTAVVVIAVVVVIVAVVVLHRRKASSKMSSSSAAENGHGQTGRASPEDVKSSLLWSCLAKHGRSEDGMPSGKDSEFNIKNRSGSQDLLQWVGKERVVAAPALGLPLPLAQREGEEELQPLVEPRQLALATRQLDLAPPQTESPSEGQPLLDHSATETAATQPPAPEDRGAEPIRPTVEATCNTDEDDEKHRGPSSTQPHRGELQPPEDTGGSPDVDPQRPAAGTPGTVSLTEPACPGAGRTQEDFEVSWQDEIDLRSAAYSLGVKEKIRGRQFPFNTGSAQRDASKANPKCSVFDVFPNSPGTEQF